MFLALLAAARAPERKAVIKNADMSEEMQQEVIDCAATAMENAQIEKDIAACALQAGAA
jgi:hypothetical protein